MPSTFLLQNSPISTVSLRWRASPSAFSSLLQLASPTSWPQPESLQQLLKPAANFAVIGLASECAHVRAIELCHVFASCGDGGQL